MKSIQTSLAILAMLIAATALSHAADAAAKPVTAKSTFTIPSNAKEGRDPFFPESTRSIAPRPPEQATNSTPVITDPSAIVVNGITFNGTNSSAMINGHSYKAGDRDIISTKSGKVSIHCLEIRANSVIVELNGVKQELYYKH